MFYLFKENIHQLVLISTNPSNPASRSISFFWTKRISTFILKCIYWIVLIVHERVNTIFYMYSFHFFFINSEPYERSLWGHSCIKKLVMWKYTLCYIYIYISCRIINKNGAGPARNAVHSDLNSFTFTASPLRLKGM